MRKIWIHAVCGLGLSLCATQHQAQRLVSAPTPELSEIYGCFLKRELHMLVDTSIITLADGAGRYQPQRVEDDRAIALASSSGSLNRGRSRIGR